MAKPHQIDVENPDTWPSEIKQALERHFELFRSYEQERQRLFDLYCRDWFAHQREGGNVHAQDRQAVIDEITGLTTPHDISGFHCTRLCDDEIEHIRGSGMVPSSASFLANRIEARATAGDIPGPVAERLLRENQAAKESRIGMIWFVNGASILREDEGGLYRLFRYWGGEALYGLHEHDVETAPLLQRLGQPCIVAASLPIASYKNYRLTGEALYAAFMRSRGIKTDGSTGMAGNMRMPITAERIDRIIRFDDPEFEGLTRCSSWRLKIA